MWCIFYAVGVTVCRAISPWTCSGIDDSVQGCCILYSQPSFSQYISIHTSLKGKIKKIIAWSCLKLKFVFFSLCHPSEWSRHIAISPFICLLSICKRILCIAVSLYIFIESNMSRKRHWPPRVLYLCYLRCPCWGSGWERHDVSRTLLVPFSFMSKIVEVLNWNCRFFLMHLINKPDTEYTGQETHVWELYQQRCWDFFPVGDCFRKQYEDELGGAPKSWN